jgi:hypothetical protein
MRLLRAISLCAWCGFVLAAELRPCARLRTPRPRTAQRRHASRRRYFDLANAEGDPRHVGYAEAALRHWPSNDAPVEVLYVRGLPQRACGALAPRAFSDYVREGVWHVWIAFDHILFLLSLLLPAVFVWSGARRALRQDVLGRLQGRRPRSPSPSLSSNCRRGSISSSVLYNSALPRGTSSHNKLKT